MTTRIDTPVLIAGAGPVGLTAALDLAWRGIPVLVVEPRHAGEPPPVKCNHVASRSMEVFRRLGLVEDIRAAGLPDDYPNDVVFCTTVTGTEFARIPIPSPADRARARRTGSHPSTAARAPRFRARRRRTARGRPGIW